MRDIRKCNVAVVGGAGFLGSHLVNHLVEDRECKVLVIDNLCAGRFEFVHKAASFEYLDITDSESAIYRLFKHYNIEYVLNYAAYPYIPDSFARPLHVFNVNAFGALKVINAAQEVGCKGILQVSSAEIYGNCKRAIDEYSPVEPHSSYGASKAAIDSMVQVRWRESKAPVISLRQFNCIGERDFNHPYVVPEIIMQIANSNHTDNVPIKLGNNSTRDFMYAGDAVRMAVELLENGSFGEVYNLGSEESIGIYDLAKKIGELMNVNVHIWNEPARNRPWEIWSLRSNNAKIYGCVTHRPKVYLEEALKRTIVSISKENYTLSWFKQSIPYLQGNS